MRVWIDLANSPHVAIAAPLVERLRERGDDVLLTARDHAQTVPLAVARWPGEVVVIGGPSPNELVGKAVAVARRGLALAGLARAERPDVAFAHGSYSQAIAARLCGVPVVTMMDYEHQPANHLSFRLAEQVIVPRTFPVSRLRLCGAHGRKVRRYEGFKEQLYLAGFHASESVLERIPAHPDRLLVVARPAPLGALYHREANARFDRLVGYLAEQPRLQVVLLTRSASDRIRYGRLRGVFVPEAPLDALSLMAFADVMVGAGGTMTRESALLGTPTYTVFAGRQSAVDRELIRLGKLRDLDGFGDLALVRRASPPTAVPPDAGDGILATVLAALDSAGAAA